MSRFWTDAFSEMVAPARHRPALWRLILGIVLAVFVYALFVAGEVIAARLIGGPGAIPWIVEGFRGTGSAAQTALLLASFGGMALGAVVAARVLHKRPARTLFGTDAGLFWRDFFRCFGAVTVLIGGSGMLYLVFGNPVPNQPLDRWLVWILPALGLVLLQIGAEEMFFRGYLQTQLAARFRAPFFWFFLPALLFGIAHYNGQGGVAWVLVVAATVFGLIAADLTARTGSIGAAMGFHMANNVLALLIVSVDGTITGLSLYVTGFTADEIDMTRPIYLFDAAVMILAWLACRRLVRR